MIYECEQCETVLGPGLTRCPHCGEPFDEPVPADATLVVRKTSPAMGEERTHDRPVDVEPVRRSAAGRARRRVPALGVLLLLGLGVLLLAYGLTFFNPHAQSPPGGPVVSEMPTDLAAHPKYAARMNAFVRQLRATGVGAEWPAFGSNDMLLVTTPRLVNGQRADWDKDTCQRLGQGIYGYFAQSRYESGFADTDATACFVIVSTMSGQVIAVDMMGYVE